MTKWISVQHSSHSSDELGPQQLAWLGDAVWELHHRLRLCESAAKSKDLHESVVEYVQAGAQATALLKLESVLTDFEKDLVRRGRNKAGKGPKNANSAIYAKATGFETMVGWLFLKDPKRLAHLFDLLKEKEINR